MLRLGIGLQVIAIVVDLNQLRVLFALQSNAGNTDVIDALTPQADLSDQLMRITGYSQTGLFVLIGILFLTWIHQANKNARGFGAKDMAFTPGWAIGWYFIPIANLWKPFQAMAEIYRASAEAGNWKAEPVPSLLGWWWFFWLTDNFMARVVLRVTQYADQLSSIIGGTYLQIISDLITIPDFWFATLLLRAVHARQALHAQTPPVVPPDIVPRDLPPEAAGA